MKPIKPSTPRLLKVTLFSLLSVILDTSTAHLSTRSAPAATPEFNKQHLAAHYGRLPLSFEINRGQTDAQVKFLSRGSGYSVFLTPDEVVLALRATEAKQGKANCARAIQPHHLTRSFRTPLRAPILPYCACSL